MDLPEKVVLAFAEVDRRIKSLSDKKAKMLASAIEKYGETSGVVKDNTGLEEKPFLRVKIIDNLASVKEGKRHHVSTYFTRYDVEITRLKNKPK